MWNLRDFMGSQMRKWHLSWVLKDEWVLTFFPWPNFIQLPLNFTNRPSLFSLCCPILVRLLIGQFSQNSPHPRCLLLLLFSIHWSPHCSLVINPLLPPLYSELSPISTQNSMQWSLHLCWLPFPWIKSVLLCFNSTVEYIFSLTVFTV